MTDDDAVMPTPTAMPPSRSKPIAVTIEGGGLFACWVEALDDRTRWVFVGADRVRHNGPAYRGEDSLAAIKRVVSDWAANTRGPHDGHDGASTLGR